MKNIDFMLDFQIKIVYNKDTMKGEIRNGDD